MSRELADHRSLAILSLGHLTNDLNPGCVLALLPFLVAQRHYSFAAAAGLVLASTLTSSIFQPVLGLAADRHPLPWLISAGILLSGSGIALVGIMPTYWLVFSAVLVCGLGVGAFHPEAARFSNFVSGPRRATSMSVFSVGGGIGFGLGPAAVTLLVSTFGLKGTLFLIVPALAAAGGIWLSLPRLNSFRPAESEERRPASPTNRNNNPAFVRLTVAGSMRSIVYFSAITFAPLYIMQAYHATPAQSNLVLALVLLAGPLGTLIVGQLADDFGVRNTLLTSFALMTAMLATFLLSGYVVGSIALIILGATSVATFSLVLVMAQEYLPRNLGLASGIALGVPDGIGGLVTPSLGGLADHLGLKFALWCAVAVGVVMTSLAIKLPPFRSSLSG